MSVQIEKKYYACVLISYLKIFSTVSSEVALHGGEEGEKCCWELQRNGSRMAILAKSFIRKAVFQGGLTCK
jgi:hypothetical protein